MGDAAEHRRDSAHDGAVERLSRSRARHAGAAGDAGQWSRGDVARVQARDRCAVRHDVGRRRAIRFPPAARCSGAGSAATRRCDAGRAARAAACGPRSRSARSRASARITATCPRAVRRRVHGAAQQSGRVRLAADARRGDVRAGDVRRSCRTPIGRYGRDARLQAGIAMRASRSGIRSPSLSHASLCCAPLAASAGTRRRCRRSPR